MSFYQQTFYKVFDFTILSFRKRFKQADYKIYLSLENLLLKAVKREDFTNELHIPTKFYDEDFYTERLQLHLKIFSEDCAELPTKDLKSILEHLKKF